MEKGNKENKRRPMRPKREESEFAQNIVDLARVTRVMAGGKRMNFRACVVIGDKKGRVGMGLAKAKDVPMAVQKAVRQAEKALIKVNMSDGTIPHEVYVKDGASKILLKPAPQGTGIISGGATRIVLELSGIENVVSKILGTNNKVNNVRATIKALEMLKRRPRKEKREEKAVEGKVAKKEKAAEAK